MAVSQVTISNEALAELRERPIQSMDESGLQAQECRRQYPNVLAEMLEAHEWGFAGSRVTLAPATNDRPAEWAYAYAMPQGVGTPRRILPNLSGNVGVYSYPAFPGITANWTENYIIEGSTIYSWMPEAVLEYGAADVSADRLPALFRRALALSMAERMAMALRNDMTLKQQLQKDAAIALQRAMADDLNRQPNRDAFDDVAAVRDGADLILPAWMGQPR